MPPYPSLLVSIAVTTTLLASADFKSEKDLLWGHVSYPAKGNIRMQAGTVELWFRYDGDPEEKLERYSRFTIFEFHSEKPYFLMGISVRGNDKTGPNPTVLVDLRGRDEDDKPVEQFLGAPFKDEPNAFHHVAVGWDLKAMKAWVALDGKVTSEVALNTGLWYAMSRASTEGRLRLGVRGKYGHHSQIVVDEFRISDVMRPVEQLGANLDQALRPDPSTLLLDAFDGDFTPDGKTQTKAAFISGFSGEKGGLPTQHTRFVPGKFGKGLQLYVDKNKPRPTSEVKESKP